MSRCFPLGQGRAPGAIFLTVLGFIIYWPLGLAMIAYMLWGDRLHEGVRAVRRQFDESFNRGGNGSGPLGSGPFGAGGFRDTGNVAFDEYRTRELNRLEEERRKLDAMRADFDTFLRELRRAKDQDEFDRFMRTRGFGGDGQNAG